MGSGDGASSGGGIVADSDPESEFEESNNKARAIVRAAEEAIRYFSGGNGPRFLSRKS